MWSENNKVGFRSTICQWHRNNLFRCYTKTLRVCFTIRETLMFCVPLVFIFMNPKRNAILYFLFMNSFLFYSLSFIIDVFWSGKERGCTSFPSFAPERYTFHWGSFVMWRNDDKWPQNSAYLWGGAYNQLEIGRWDLGT